MQSDLSAVVRGPAGGSTNFSPLYYTHFPTLTITIWGQAMQNVYNHIISGVPILVKADINDEILTRCASMIFS